MGDIINLISIRSKIKLIVTKLWSALYTQDAAANSLHALVPQRWCRREQSLSKSHKSHGITADLLGLHNTLLIIY